jgi:hypothetical protein
MNKNETHNWQPGIVRNGQRLQSAPQSVKQFTQKKEKGQQLKKKTNRYKFLIAFS